MAKISPCHSRDPRLTCINRNMLPLSSFWESSSWRKYKNIYGTHTILRDNSDTAKATTSTRVPNARSRRWCPQNYQPQLLACHSLRPQCLACPPSLHAGSDPTCPPLNRQTANPTRYTHTNPGDKQRRRYMLTSKKSQLPR